MTKFEELVLEEVKGPYEEKIAKIEMSAEKDRKAKIQAEKANQNMIKLLLENGVSAEVIEKANQVL